MPWCKEKSVWEFVAFYESMWFWVSTNGWSIYLFICVLTISEINSVEISFSEALIETSCMFCPDCVGSLNAVATILNANPGPQGALQTDGTKLNRAEVLPIYVQYTVSRFLRFALDVARINVKTHVYYRYYFYVCACFTYNMYTSQNATSLAALWCSCGCVPCREEPNEVITIGTGCRQMSNVVYGYRNHLWIYIPKCIQMIDGRYDPCRRCRHENLLRLLHGGC